MTTKTPLYGIDEESMAHPSSAFALPPDVRFSDNRDGREARMLLASYGELLAQACKEHAPVQVVREIAARITEITTKAVAAEIRRATASETRN